MAQRTSDEDRRIRDTVARQSRPLNDPAANWALARQAQDAQTEGRERGRIGG